MISHTNTLNMKVYPEQKKKKEKRKRDYFLSVEDQSTIDKKWKKVEFYGSSVLHFYVRVLYFIAILFGLSFI